MLFPVYAIPPYMLFPVYASVGLSLFVLQSQERMLIAPLKPLRLLRQRGRYELNCQIKFISIYNNNKVTKSSLGQLMLKLRKDGPIEHILHQLNTSKTKLAYSFQKTTRFLPDQSFSPNKFYDLPSAFVNRSVSPQRSMRSSFEQDATFSPWKHNLSASLEGRSSLRQRSNTTFGIGREQYYKGRSDKSQLGPGAYTVNSPMQKNIYIGRKIEPISPKRQPDCTSYHVTAETYNKLSSNKTNGAYRMKVEYYPKAMLQPYDNKIPGPGSYNRKGMAELTQSRSYRQSFQRKKAHSGFGIGERMKTQSTIAPAPNFYNRFSEFGKTKY